MKTFLILLLLIVIPFGACCQAVGEPYNIAACEADFVADADSLNPMMVRFRDQSSGQITLWQWYFGDGSTSTDQNPVHTFGHGGTFYVCLTISGSDTANPCHDVYCMAVTIHEPGTCVADYQYTIDPANRLKVLFTDRSSGNINGWHWNFGDGSSSDEQDPVHLFTSYGKYKVCLTAYNIDSVSVCNSIRCDTVEIVPAGVCLAMFTSRLDSLNLSPNTFIFENRSTGELNKYNWTFDDGATYNTRDVTHQFQLSGKHEVCLTVMHELQGEIVCADSICHEVATANYFDLGGHLFAGQYPVNNPVNNGDTGIAMLYRVDGSKLSLYHKSTFTYLGYYTFPKVLNGTYLVRAMLTPGSPRYREYFPGYFQEATGWKDAEVLQLTDNNSYAADIHLMAVAGTGQGPAMVRGKVITATSKGISAEISDAEVILSDATSEPVMFTFTGAAGLFEFQSLPYGQYHLAVEYPGKYSRSATIWLDASKPLADSILLEVFDHDVTAVQEIPRSAPVIGEPFPNPSSGDVTMRIGASGPAALKFSIRNLAGMVAWEGTMVPEPGFGTFILPVGSFQPGVYFIIIQTTDGTMVGVKKLIRF